jgi:HEAT repeat protein
MRKVLLAGIGVLVLAAAVWLEPTGVVQGWLRGEAFYRNRPAHYWSKGLTDPDPKTEMAARQALKEGGSQAVPVLAELLRSDRVGARWKAAEMLGQMEKEAQPAVPALVQALHDDDAHVRFVAASALDALGYTGSETIPVWQTMLSSDNPLPAIRGLAHCGTAAAPAVPRLIELLQDRDSEIRWNAARTLGLIGPQAKAAVPALISALKKDDDPLVREHAAEALGDIGPDAKDAVEPLTAALKDPDARVRRDAVRSLGQIGPSAKSAVADVQRLLKDPVERVRKAAEAAYQKLLK